MSESREAYERINSVIVPRVLAHFEAKQRDYSGGPAFLLLGARGQFSDINRKFWKLYRAVWENLPLEGEQPEEIVEDFIGHCLLLLYCLEQESQLDFERRPVCGACLDCCSRQPIWCYNWGDPPEDLWRTANPEQLSNLTRMFRPGERRD